MWANGEADPLTDTCSGTPLARHRRYVRRRTVTAGGGLSTTMPGSLRAQEKVMRIDRTPRRCSRTTTATRRRRLSPRRHLEPRTQRARRRCIFVVGVGGGRDVLSALEFGQRSVTGIKINRHPRRSPTAFTATSRATSTAIHASRSSRMRPGATSHGRRTFDLIQMSLIDTWAASSAGAFALSENSLLHDEAWDTFLDRLTPNGLLSVSRL